MGLPAAPPSVSEASLSDSDDEVNAGSTACGIAIGDGARQLVAALTAAAPLPVLSGSCHGCHSPLLERASAASGSAGSAALLPLAGLDALARGLRPAGEPVGDGVSAKNGAIAATAGVRSSLQTWARACPSKTATTVCGATSSDLAPAIQSRGVPCTYEQLAHGVPDVR